jgi:hypothetical protein
MKHCPVCSTEYNDEFFFCENDGNKLEEKPDASSDLNIGDKNIISGDINITQSSSQTEVGGLGGGTNLSIGDKNIISGDINVENTTNIDTVVINKDDTNQVVKCSASGRSVRIIESFQCNTCNQVFHNDYLEKNSGKCRFCEDSDKDVHEGRLKEMISERLSDMIIDEQELNELTDFSKSIGYPHERLEVLISEIKNELIAGGRANLSEYEQELLKLSRVYFDSFNMGKLKESISQLYPKFKSQPEVRWYYFLSHAIVDASEFQKIQDAINYDEVELFKADYFNGIHRLNLNSASSALSKLNTSFSAHPFPKLMQFDLELHKFLGNPYSEDEFEKLQQVLPGFLKQQIKFESYPFEEGLQRFFQGLYVLLFKMPLKSLFNNNVLIGLKQTSEFGYNRFIGSNFWKDSLKSQNEIYRILKVSGNNKQVLELCEKPLLKALNEYKSGKLDSIVDSDEFKFKELDPKVKNSFDQSFIESKRIFNLEKTIPFTDILIDNAGGISVPISLKFKVSYKVKDLKIAAETFADKVQLGSSDIKRLADKLFLDKLLSDFGRVMSSMQVKIDQLSSKTSDFEQTFLELNGESFLRNHGVELREFEVIRLTPDKESNAYQKAINSGKPPIIKNSNSMYHMNVNNVNYGPYSVQQLAGMVSTGQFTNETMVWCEGMAQWDIASNVYELKQLF